MKKIDRSSGILPISMLIGIVGYLIYANIPALDSTHRFASQAVDILQPVLLFLMLFMSFCRIDFRDLTPHRWQIRLLAVQLIGAALSTLPLLFMADCLSREWRLLLQSFMLCFITPTATAAVVVTNKLGGRIGYVVSYTVVINVVAAIAFPAIISAINTSGGMQHHIGFLQSFLMILWKVFPVLILPLVTAFMVRYFLPRFHRFLSQHTNWAFYLWAVTLVFCMGITTHAVVTSSLPVHIYIMIAATGLICCAVQFFFGHVIGSRFGHDRVAGGQTLGQKNTSLAIWLAYTFLDPVTALAGGFYIIWQNLYNSWQLQRAANKA